MNDEKETAEGAERPFKVWYDKNHEGWNEKRRDRYATDPDYRATVLERNRKHRSARKLATQKEREEKRKAQLYAPKPGFKQFVTVIDGKKVTQFTIGAYAQRLGVSVQAVRLWERNGVIAGPTMRASGNQRVYTFQEIEKNRKILLAQGRITAQAHVPSDEERAHPYIREVIYPNGRVRKERMYTIGVLAQTVHLTVVTLSHHERKGYLPRTPFRGAPALPYEDPNVKPVRRRLYTKPMIDVVIREFEKRPLGLRGVKEWKAFYNDVLTGWTKLGVMGAKLKKAATKKQAE